MIRTEHCHRCDRVAPVLISLQNPGFFRTNRLLLLEKHSVRVSDCNNGVLSSLARKCLHCSVMYCPGWAAGKKTAMTLPCHKEQVNYRPHSKLLSARSRSLFRSKATQPTLPPFDATYNQIKPIGTECGLLHLLDPCVASSCPREKLL